MDWREMTIEDRQRETLARGAELWKVQEETAKKMHDALDEYMEAVFVEWTTVRGCSAEAAYGVVKDRVERFRDHGIQDHLNRLYREKVM